MQASFIINDNTKLLQLDEQMYTCIFSIVEGIISGLIVDDRLRDDIMDLLSEFDQRIWEL